MKRISVDEAPSQLCDLIKYVETGAEVIIEDAGEPIARLIRFQEPGKRQLGYDEGLGYIAPDFDTYIPEGFEEYL